MNEYKNWWGEGACPSEHAEAAAIRRCGKADLRNAILYVSRVNNMGQEMMSKPCENCQQEIKRAGIRKIVYTI